MAKLNPYDRKHLRNLDLIETMVDRIFKKATEEAARIGVSIKDVNPDRMFSFDDYPQTKEEVDAMLESLHDQLEAVIVNGVRSEWSLSNNKNNELANRVFGDNVGSLTKSQYNRYFSSNEPALEAFIARKNKGLNLSDNVWRYTDQFKDEIEAGLHLGISEGHSADEMSRVLRSYLKYPDKLFRRIREKDGNLRLSKAAKAFHPGRGVYRSSYMNARRLASTETNIAYRTSDHLRWQQMDFVVGIEIKLSNNHTCLGKDGKPHPFYDICDRLKGRYPKDFKFTGWHPHCRCHAESILKAEQEMAEDTKKILNGEEPDNESVNKVTEYPDGFKEWVEQRRDKIAKAPNPPYFVRDNRDAVNRVLGIAPPTPKPVQKPTPVVDDAELERRKWEMIERLNSFYLENIYHNYLPEEAGMKMNALMKAGDYEAFMKADKVMTQAIKRHQARTPQQKAGIQRRWDKRYVQGKPIERLGKSIKGIDYVPYSEDMTIAQLGKMLKARYGLYMGEGGIAMIERAIEDFEYGMKRFKWTKEEVLAGLRSRLNSWDWGVNTPGEAILKSVNEDLKLLKTIKERDVPLIWRDAFNDAMKRINAFDFPTKGIFDKYNTRGVYADIHHAANIIRLARNPLAKEIGFENISHMMPDDVLSVFCKRIPGFKDDLPVKEFWDSLKDYVHLLDTGENNAYFSGQYFHVHISQKEMSRWALPTERKNIFYHEYGHAYDWQTGLRTNPEIVKVYDDWAKVIKADDAKTIEKAIQDRLDEFTASQVKEIQPLVDRCNELDKLLSAGTITIDSKEYREAYKAWETMRNAQRDALSDLEEQLGGLSDCVQAAIEGSRWIRPIGHDMAEGSKAAYFANHTSQMAEFIAHASENYWQGNPEFKRLAPELYEETRRLMKVLMDGRYRR